MVDDIVETIRLPRSGRIDLEYFENLDTKSAMPFSRAPPSVSASSQVAPEPAAAAVFLGADVGHVAASSKDSSGGSLIPISDMVARMMKGNSRIPRYVKEWKQLIALGFVDVTPLEKLYEKANSEVLTLMCRDSFARFRLCPAYERLKGRYKDNEATNKALVDLDVL